MKEQTHIKRVLPDYLNYMGLFVGAGFLSGALVHIPLDPLKFSLIGLVGIVLFVGSTIVNEMKMTKQAASSVGLLKLIAYSSILAIGVGMISGGIQHFTEFPDYLAVLIPVGIVLSIVGYVLGHGVNLSNEHAEKLAVGALIAVVVTAFGLNAYANALTKDTVTTPTQLEIINGEAADEQQLEEVDGHSH